MPPNDEIVTVDHCEVVYDHYFRIEKELLKIPDQDDYTYYTLIGAPVAVMILAKTEDERYVLNREYRHPVREILLSCPGGVKGEDESPLECAERELLEETGFKAESFEIIGESYPFPGVCTQKTVYVTAKNAFDTGKHAREHAEFILETVLLTHSDIKRSIQNKIPIDGLLLSALSFELLK